MSDPTNTGRLELDVTDFRPTSRAKVDLRPLTVLVGPSNTGKSYLSILIYALHSFFHNRVSPMRHRLNLDHEDTANFDSTALSKSAISALKRWNESSPWKDLESGSDQLMQFPDYMAKLLCDIMNYNSPSLDVGNKKIFW